MKVVDARRALRGEVERALALLSAKQALDDDSIHAVRQALKRARAALRLLRDAVTDVDYRRENRALRDAARPLASARDLAVMLELLDELMAARKLRRYRPLLARLRVRLREAHDERIAEVRARYATLPMRALLEQSLERTARWRLPRDPRPVYRAGLRRVYARGRRELEAALARDGATALHEWRKQAKYLALALQIIGVRGADQGKAGKRADRLAALLGDDHDLAMLMEALRRKGARGPSIRELKKERRKLQKLAMNLGHRIYKRPPGWWLSSTVIEWSRSGATMAHPAKQQS